MKDLFLIMNPGSRSGKSKRMFGMIFKELDALNVSYDYKKTETLEDAFIFSREANERGYSTIVAVGGDGTINKVLSGFYNDAGKKLSASKFGIIYTGTSPDFCKSYDIPLDIVEATKAVVIGKSRCIPIGRVVHSQGMIGYFGCCSNIGLGATLARKANSGIRKYLGDFLGTFLSLIHTLIEYKPSDVIVDVDGEKLEVDKMMSISVGITKYIASGIKVKTELEEGESRFYKLTINNARWFQWPAILKSVYSGSIKNSEYMNLDYGKKIIVDGSGEVEFDGDPQGVLPCEITIADEKLELMHE